MMARYPSESISAHVIYRDRARCQYCGQDCRDTRFIVEHVVPHALGGPSETYNLVVACRPCNTRKSRSIWIPRNFLEITLNHPEWRAKVVRLLLQQTTERLTAVEAWQIISLIETQATVMRAALEQQ